MGNSATTGVVFYWKPDLYFDIHRAHTVWFDGYNSHLYIEDNHTALTRQDLLNLIPCEPDITHTPLRDTKIITYEIELPPSGKKIGFNLLYDEYFKIPYVIDKIKNSPAGHQLTTQAKKMCG